MSITGRSIIIERDTSAILVPSGHIIELKAGTPVRVTQAMGGHYTVEVFGNLVMIGHENQDALGLEVDTELFKHIHDDTIDLDTKVNLQLKTCYDPEIPVNIYELGLIYDVMITDGHVRIVMTLTSPTCGMGPFIVEEVKRRLHLIPDVLEVDVEPVFDPPWNRERMSKAAMLQLNLL